MSTTPQSIVEDRRSRQRHAALTCEEDDVWNASQARENTPGAMVKAFTFSMDSQDTKCFVKFTSTRIKGLLEVERHNHEFAFNTLRELQQQASQESELLVCVPEIFRAFEYLDHYFLIMEFVPGKTLYQLSWEDACAGRPQREFSTSCRYSEEGIRMLCVKAPPGAKPGPVGGGLIRHPLFKNCEATIPYRDVEMLETHLNKVISLRTFRDPDWTPTVRLEKELEFCYFNRNVRNFIIMTLGNHTVLYMLNFIDASFVPPSFVTMLLRRSTTFENVPGFGHTVQREEGDEENQLALRTVEYFLQTSINTFGLPLEGYPETELGEIRRRRDQDFL